MIRGIPQLFLLQTSFPLQITGEERDPVDYGYFFVPLAAELPKA
jgi:hypothetical protein